jgi:integrase
MALTDQQCRRKADPKRDQWLSDGGLRGAGRLALRITKSGSRLFYYRYTRADGTRDALEIGAYHPKGAGGGRTLQQASDEAAKLSALYRSGIRDLREHLERERVAAEAAKARAEAEAKARAEADQRGSLQALLEAYTGSLEARGASSAADVGFLLKRHVYDPHPGLAARKAADLTAKDLQPILRTLTDTGKGRTAGKVRSYLFSAYRLAMRAEHDPSAPAAMLGFGVESNPVDAIPALSHLNGVGERSLSTEEFGHYLREVLALQASAAVKAALVLGVLLGGQRPQQLLRVVAKDVDLDERTVTLRDPKGRRRTPRLHVLPLTDLAADVFEDLLAITAEAPSVFSAHGKAAVRLETLSEHVRRISDNLLAAGKIKAPFRLGDIRRTCETHLARLRVGKDIRAQLLSHGIGGVQDRHYDRHTYLPEKLAALETWEAELERLARSSKQTATIVNINARRLA